MLVKDFIKKFPDTSLDMMTPGGPVFLTAEQAKDLLVSKTVVIYPSDPEFPIKVDSDALLSAPVYRTRWKNHVCDMIIGYAQNVEQENGEKEVSGGMKKEKEQKLRERLNASYEAYIQQLKEKPVSDLIDMATEISAVQFVYAELSKEGEFLEFLDYLLQFENPLEVVSKSWLEYSVYDYHEEIKFLLEDNVDRWMESSCSAIEESTIGISLKQGVAMC